MRPLPRVFAMTDTAVCRRDDFPVRVAAVASGGSSVAIVVRAPDATSAEQLAWLDRAAPLVRPPEAALFAHGDPALAAAARANGVHLRRSDLGPGPARTVLGDGWIGVSIHDAAAARAAFEHGADYVFAGNVFETASHPGRPARGLDWLAGLVGKVSGRVVAIGGVTIDRVPQIMDTGVWGVAALSGLFAAGDPAAVTDGMLEATLR